LKYVNAKDVLPPSLLGEVQQYIVGEMLYIPKKETERAGWGQVNGTRSSLHQRNRDIITAYRNGTDIYSLMEAYCLSEASIRRIVHRQNTKKGT